MKINPQHLARGGGQGSPGKTIHYNTNGTGRDSYIHANQGGFMCNYSFANDRDVYVNSLRAYPTSIAGAQRQINADKKKGLSPRRDHFVEG